MIVMWAYANINAPGVILRSGTIRQNQFLGKGVERGSADDQVIQEWHPKQFACGSQAIGNQAIFLGGRWVTRWVIVCHDYAGCAAMNGGTEHLSRVHCDCLCRAYGHVVDCNDVVPRVQVEGNEVFSRFSTDHCERDRLEIVGPFDTLRHVARIGLEGQSHTRRAAIRPMDLVTFLWRHDFLFGVWGCYFRMQWVCWIAALGA